MSGHAIITRPDAPIRAVVRLPRSKSLANRALIAAHLAGDPDCVTDPGDAEDTRLLLDRLRDRPPVLDCGLGGTTFRFLLAWAAVQDGEERLLTGAPRLLARPHDDLVEALIALGADITRAAEGYRVRGKRLRGGEVAFASPISSQYLSALMLVAPTMERGVRIAWQGAQLSRPYVEMTARVMRHFGAEVVLEEALITVEPGRYVPAPFTVPPDWSAAAFWYEVVALSADAVVELPGLPRDGWQGDEAVSVALRGLVRSEQGGAGATLRSVDPGAAALLRLDLAATPDLFQPLLAAFAGGRHPVHLTGLRNLRVKETDRIAAMLEALGHLGYHLSEPGEGEVLCAEAPVLRSPNAPLATHGDHRMAMALAPLALVHGRIVVADPDVVRKSYAGFWDDLRDAGFGVQRVG